MAEPLVSVKMITYNHVRYIAQAIEGVMQQKTSFPFELVIGEDCSTDGAREIVFDYQKKYPDIIRVITSDKNVGMKKNAYRTTKACRGKYIAFCEGDDYWHNQEKLEKQVEFMEKYPEWSMVCSDYDQVSVAKGKRIKYVNRERGLNPSKINNFSLLLSGSTGIQTCTAMTRRHMNFQVIDGDPILYQSTRFLIGDLPLWAEISMLGHIGYIDESLATYNRLLESATSSTDVSKILRISISNKELILYLVEKYKLSQAERDRHILDLWKRRLKLAFYERDMQMADCARRVLERLSMLEWLQFLGSKNLYLNKILRPTMVLLCKNLIPTEEVKIT